MMTRQHMSGNQGIRITYDGLLRLVVVLFPALHEAFPSLYLMRLTSNSSRTGGDAEEDDVGVGLWLQGYS
ncbi:hypothetical protein Patl1_32018 [Pistacia atlantica]|uniref:Uncharacterized protein n=1 Tax=Pistacia atlantica TaxID=434234 RepID=A0ACC1APT9_9ROSI|nr:hypothetical protein Patl1_32018 [Pistacia atlantica]